MSDKKKLEDLFTSISGVNFVEQIEEEKKQKEDAEKIKHQKLAEEKKIKEEKQKLTEQQKIQALEDIFGLPKFEEQVKEQIKKVEEEAPIESVPVKKKRQVNEQALLQSLGSLFGSINKYKQEKIKQNLNNLEEDLISLGNSIPMSTYLDSLNKSYIPESNKQKIEHKPIQSDINTLLQSKKQVNNINDKNVLKDINHILDERNVRPYMKQNIGQPIVPVDDYVDRDHLFEILTNKSKSLQEQIEGGDLTLEEVVSEFNKFKQLTTLQLQSLGGGGAAKLSDLDDVNTSTQQNGYALKYNSSTGKYDFGEVATDLSAVDQNIIPDADGTRDIGSTAKAFNNGYFKNVYVEGSTLQVDTDATLTGNTTIGNANTDTVSVNARFSTGLVPDTNVAYDLGTSSLRWRDLYLSGNTIDLAGATISGDGTGAITISATGATLPVGSKLGTKKIAQSNDAGVATKDVPFFTKAGGLVTANATFTMAAGSSRASVFTNFTKADGTQQPRFELFSF